MNDGCGVELFVADVASGIDWEEDNVVCAVAGWLADWLAGGSVRACACACVCDQFFCFFFGDLGKNQNPHTQYPLDSDSFSYLDSQFLYCLFTSPTTSTFHNFDRNAHPIPFFRLVDSDPPFG